jgi:DNA-binding NarL/FixJ family response regulator
MDVIQTSPDATEPARLLLIDDHPLFCDAMAMTVADIFSKPDIRTASSLNAAIDTLKSFPSPNIIVLDLNLPDVEGLEGLVRLQTLAPKSKIAVVSSLSDNRIIASVMAAGAAGFVPKESPRAELIHAFSIMAEGGRYTPADFVPPEKQIDQQDHASIMARLESLTPQQAKILELICQGKLNKQIAYDLSIVETTVKAHLTAILRKLGVQNRTQTVLLAQKVSFRAITDDTERTV